MYCVVQLYCNAVPLFCDTAGHIRRYSSTYFLYTRPSTPYQEFGSLIWSITDPVFLVSLILSYNRRYRPKRPIFSRTYAVAHEINIEPYDVNLAFTAYQRLYMDLVDFESTTSDFWVRMCSDTLTDEYAFFPFTRPENVFSVAIMPFEALEVHTSRFLLHGYLLSLLGNCIHHIDYENGRSNSVMIFPYNTATPYDTTYKHNSLVLTISTVTRITHNLVSTCFVEGTFGTGNS